MVYRKEYRLRWEKSKTRPRAVCHPNKPHRARGLCSACYDRWLYKNSKKNRETKLRNARKWRSEHLAQVKKQQCHAKRKTKYGISKEEYEEMVVSQNNRCAICDKEFSKTPHVDHDHKTGHVRGLLCLVCNGTLSLLERVLNNDEWTEKAKKYLNQPNPLSNPKA